MDQFDKARAKYEKNRASQGRPLPVIAKKEEPKTAPVNKGTNKGVEPMVLKITGLPFGDMTIEVDYAGTLVSSQVQEKNLKEMFKKCLLPIGRVR